MIIGVNGYAGSGKDTIGKIVQYICSKETKISIDVVSSGYKLHEWWLEEKSGWQIKKFADKLKDIASLLLGINKENFEDQDFKKTSLGSQWDFLSVRDFLQKLGTDGLRNGLHPNVWVNALFADYNCAPADRAPGGWDCDNWIITDTRFPNEAKAIKEKGGIVIRIDRPGIKPINNHPSEIALDDWKFDYKIANASDLVALTFTVKKILEKHGIN